MKQTWIEFVKHLFTLNPQGFKARWSGSHEDMSHYVGYIQRKYHGQHKRINYRKGTRGRI